MNTTDNGKNSSLIPGHGPYQKKELHQAERVSVAAFTLEPDKGISPDPDEFNKGHHKTKL